VNILKALLLSFRYAINGIIHAIKAERNINIHLFITFFVIVGGITLKLSLIEWSIILLTIGIMIALELINTAIERVVDLVTKDFHPLAKAAKDVSAGACLIFALISVCIGILIFLPKIVNFVLTLSCF